MFNSSVSIRQINQPELSQYISGFLTGLTTGTQTTNIYINSGAVTTGQTGNFVSTSYLASALASENLLNSFIYYPLYNPSGYITGFNSGIFYLSSNPSGFITGNYYPVNNPSGFITNESLTGLNISGVIVSGNLEETFIPYGVDLENNLLIDISTLNSLDWNNRDLYDSNGQLSIDWSNRLLVYPGIGNTSVDWYNSYLYDQGAFGGNKLALDWNNRILNLINTGNGSIGTSIDWQHQILSGNWTIQSGNFQNLKLNGNIVTTGGPYLTGFNSGQYILTGQTGVFAIDSLVVHRTGDEIISGFKTFSGIQASIILSNSFNGHYNVDNSLFYDADGGESLDYVNRVLFNQNNNVSINWQNQQLSGNWNIQSGTFINSLTISGNKVVTQNQTGSFITTGQTGAFGGGSTPTGNLTGVFYPLISNPSSYATISLVNSLSGYLGTNYISSGAITTLLTSYLTNSTASSTYASISNLILTGSTLQSEITSLNNWTGITTGLYYPYFTNPNNYITSSQTGIFITTGQTGAFGGGSTPTGNLTGAFYPLNSNPSNYLTSFITSGYATTTGSQTFVGTVNTFSGFVFINSSYYLSCPVIQGVNILGSNNGSSLNIQNVALQDTAGVVSIDWGNRLLKNTSAVTTLDYQNRLLSGTWAVQSLSISGSPVITSAQTGVFYPISSNPNSYIVNSVWSNLTCLPTTIWNVTTGIVEDRKILNLTGSVNLSISGLYNGWNGVLETVQVGSGYNLTLPSGTKVAYNSSGQVSLTTGISGSIDILAFSYDGLHLFCNIANMWT